MVLFDTKMPALRELLNQGHFGRKVQGSDDAYILGESLVAYNDHFPYETDLLSTENSYFLLINCG